MKNKTGKVKWTKKLRAVVISLTLAFTVALGGALAAIISTADKNGRLSGTTVDKVVDGELPKVPEVTDENAIFYAGKPVDDTTYTAATAWEAAIAYSLAHDGEAVRFDLKESWTGVAPTINTTTEGEGESAVTTITVENAGGFGTQVADDPEAEELTYVNSPFGAAGSLNVPAGAQIVLNIGENVVLNRNVGTTAIDNGEVITVSGGKLYLVGGGTISGGNTTGNGGGIHALDHSSVYVGNVVLSSNRARNGGGIFLEADTVLTDVSGEFYKNTSTNVGGGIVSAGEVTISGGKIHGNTTVSNGGGVYIDSVNTLTISGEAYINGNSAAAGGGVFIYKGTFKLNGGEISENYTSGDGGGVYLYANTTLEMINGKINSNISNSGVGAGIRAQIDTQITISGGEISHNSAEAPAVIINSYGGGAIATWGSLELNPSKNEDLLIEDNHSHRAGGIEAFGDTNITGGTFRYNRVHTTNCAGFIQIAGQKEAIISGGIFEENRTDGGRGGAIFVCSGNSLTITGGTFKNNYAGGVGGAINIENHTNNNGKATLIIQKPANGDPIEFSGNTSNNRGGAICAETGTADDINEITINGAKFTDNTATNYGGGIHLGSYNKLDISNSVFDGNTTVNHAGAGMWVSSDAEMRATEVDFLNGRTLGYQSADGAGLGSAGYVELTDCEIRGNRANAFGAGFSSDSSGKLTRVTFDSNHSNLIGGAVCIGGSSATGFEFNNVTVTNNTAGDIGGGINIKTGATCPIVFNGLTVTGNRSSTMGGGVYYGSPATHNGRIQITGNYVGADSGAKLTNNAYLYVDNAIAGDMNNVTTGSEIGVNAHEERTVYSCASALASRITVTADNGASWAVNSTTASGTTTKKIARTTTIGTTNAAMWNYAATHSTNTSPIQVDLNANWVWASGTGFGSGTGFTSGHLLQVPANKNIILNLNNWAINRTAGTTAISDGYIISVSGTLTIVGNGNITGGNNIGNGGAIIVNNGGKLVVAGGSINTNKTNGNGGAIYGDGANSNIIIEGGNISGNTAANGGGIYVNGTFEMHGGTINGNVTNVDGGGIYVNNATFTMDNGKITRNTAVVSTSSDGGAIYFAGANTKATISDSAYITGNQASYGGAIYVNNGELKITGGKIFSNTAAFSGGGVRVSTGATVYMTGGRIYSNRATATGDMNHGGGGVAMVGGVFEMSGGEIYSNRAENTANAKALTYGGGVHLKDNAVFTMGERQGSHIPTFTGTGKIYGNYSTQDGGGVYVYSSPTAATNSPTKTHFVLNAGEIYDNTSSHGANVYLWGSNSVGVMNGGEIRGGKDSGVSAGGIASIFMTTGSEFTLNDGRICDYEGNEAGDSAVYVHGHNVASTGVTTFEMHGGYICDNTTTSNGAGLCVWSETPDSDVNLTTYPNTGKVNAVIHNGRICNNKADGSGGGIFIGSKSIASGATLTIHGGEISGNTAAATGGGIYVSANAVINIGTKSANGALDGDAVISGNTANHAGGGMMVRGVLNFYSGEISGNTANDCGGGVHVERTGSSFTMNGGVISGNTAPYGGGVRLFTAGSAFTMTGGEIKNNTATISGAGVYVQSGSTFDMSGDAKISGNIAAERGGGVFVETNGTFTMNGGVIGGETEEEGNVAVRGGGIYNAGTVTLTNAVIKNNKAIADSNAVGVNLGGHGGGIYNSGTATLVSGELTYNSAAGYGGGITTPGTLFNMQGGTIVHNTAKYGGGISVSGTLNLTGGAISENTANNGGGVYVEQAGSMTVSGKPVVANNTLGGGTTLNNVALNKFEEEPYKVITVSGTLTSGAEIWVTTENTDAFTSGATATGKLSHPNLAFYADDDHLVVGRTTAGEGTLASAWNVNLNVQDGVVGGEMGSKEVLVKADKDSTVTYAANSTGITFTTQQGGTSKTTRVDVTANAGYTPALYAHGTNTEVKNGSATLSKLSGDLSLDIKYRPNADTPYRIYYIMQTLDEANGGYTTETNPVQLAADTENVRVFEGVGTTASPITYLSSDGRTALVEDIKEHYSFDKIALGNAATNGDGNPVIGGSGETYILVYMKRNEYTARFTYNGTQMLATKSYKYGEEIKGSGITVEGVNNPSRDMNTFVGWYLDSALTRALSFTEGSRTKVESDVTLYAKFDAQRFELTFNLNLGEGANQLDTAQVLRSKQANLIGPDNLDGGMVRWEHSRLFNESFGWDASGDASGVYAIHYDVNNVSRSGLSIRGTTPSAVGYTFVGWYAEGASTATTTIRRPTTSTQPIHLTAHWEPAVYTMRFDKQDNSSVQIQRPVNLSLWSEVLAEVATPVRSDGYVFKGWYRTAEDARNAADDAGIRDIYGWSSCFDIPVDEVTEDNLTEHALFSIADFGDTDPDEPFRVYGNAEEGYDFSGLTLYAGWESVGVYIQQGNISHGNLNFSGTKSDGTTGAIEAGNPNSTVRIGATISVTAAPSSGYDLSYITVNGRNLAASARSFTVNQRDLKTDDEGRLYVEVGAVFVEHEYTITYRLDGGTLSKTDNSFDRTYTISQVTAGSGSRAILPSQITKLGYNFAGWQFVTGEVGSEEELGVAFETESEEENLKGAELWLTTPIINQGDEYRNVILKAQWKAQPSYVYLYNAAYSMDDPRTQVYNFNNQGDSDPLNDRYEVSRVLVGEEQQTVTTGKEIEIVNPTRTSFEFLGWGTARNGIVVYPVEYGEDGNVTGTVHYSVNAHAAEDGSVLNKNNLYAVWQVAGVDYIVMNATNNNSTYGGNGITMTARPAQEYESDAGETILLSYYWYKVNEGVGANGQSHYDNCFDVVDYEDQDGYKVYVNESDAPVAYEKDGKYYLTDKTTEISAPTGTKLTYKVFKEESVGTSCVAMFSTTGTALTSNTVTIKDVNDCGIYICVVEVEATVDGVRKTQAGGYGEIEITMSKAVYTGVTLSDVHTQYDGASKAGSILIRATDATVETVDGVTYLVLRDTKGANEAANDSVGHGGSRFVVTYRYYVTEEGVRREITDVEQIKNVGTYEVEVSFAYAVDGDNGNYEAIETLNATLTVTQRTIGEISATFTHGGEAVEGESNSGKYDGTAYSVELEITQTIIESGVKVAEDGVELDIAVYREAANGWVRVPDGEATVNAGNYYVEIVGLTGDGAPNYILSSTLPLRYSYTIAKNTYEVSGNIGWVGGDEAVIFGEDGIPTVEFDNEIHTISVEGDKLPATVSVTYEVTEYTPEDGDFAPTAEHFALNGGRYAGKYEIKAKFTDSASANYEELPELTKTLTIKKADLLKYFKEKYGDELLQAGGFRSATYAYNPASSYDPYIAGGRLTNADNFTLTYEYYEVKNGGKQLIGSGTHTALVGQGLISEPGEYVIVPRIGYANTLYNNNFKEVTEEDSAITYTIEEVDVERVEVKWKGEFDSIKNVKLGDSFDYGNWIDHIDVYYVDSETPRVISGDDIELAVIKFGTADNTLHTTFWHVGELGVEISYFGKADATVYKFAVTEEISEVQIQYRRNDSEWTAYNSADGIPYIENGYAFKAVYQATDETGVKGPKESDLTLSGEALKVGKNVLAASETNYTFGEMSVQVYRIIGDSEVTWWYSTDGGDNYAQIGETNSVVYAGTDILVEVRFTADGGNHRYAATANGGEAIRGVRYAGSGYFLGVGRADENYEVAATYTLQVLPKSLTLTWSGNSAAYRHGEALAPEVVNSGIFETDAQAVTFAYTYVNAQGEVVANMRNVGTYNVTATLTGEGNENYEIVANAQYGYTITQAEIDMSAKYSEWTYGDNVTYAGNAKLRVDALKKTFNDGVEVLGGFKFVLPGYNAATGEYTEATEAWLAQQILRAGAVPVYYAYVPESDNYKVKFGVINLDVKNPSPKTGANSLSVEFGPNALQVYIVKQQVNTDDIRVYKLYNSAYQEDGVWYGRRDRLAAGAVSFSVNNLQANGYTITSQDLTNGRITLKASSGIDSGTIDIRVLASQPIGFTVANEGEYKKVYYVGERPDFGDILFDIELSEGAPMTNQKVGSASGIRHNLTSAFATPGTQSVTFTFLTTNLEVTLEFEVKAKEDLVVNLVTEVTQATSKVFIPEVTFTVDGETVSEYEGVSVSITMNGAPVTAIPAIEGTYELTYSFDITNPRFNIKPDIRVTVHVVEAPYIATVELPEKLKTSYTGSDITIPRPALESLIDVRNGAALNEGEYRIVWTTKDGGEANFTQKEAGKYEYVLKIMVGDVEAIINGKTELEYAFEITQAKNAAENVKIATKTVVLGDGADFKFGVTADFGAETATLTYSDSANGVYGAALPNKAGTWYVKATIAGTANYAGVEKAVSFEVRQSAVETGEGSEPGSITGGDGIGEGWTLNISKTGIDDVTINRQTGLYGYNVSLKDASGADVRTEDITDKYTVRIKLSEELAAELGGRSDIRVFMYGEDGSAEMIDGAEVKDGYVEFATKEFGRFVITSEIPKAATVPVWLLVLVIVGGVAAAGMVAACVVVFLKKKKGAK